MKIKGRHISVMIGLCFFMGVSAQEQDPISKKLQKEANKLTYEGNERIAENDFVSAEAKYRESISMNPKALSSKFNLGNAYYNQQALDEAVLTYVKSSKAAATELERHQSLHNLGNTMMLKKDYAKAVEAYKDALRNNPTDDETRYNLALAKKLLENQKEQEKQDQNKDKEQDKQDQNDQNQDKKENEDKGDGQKDDQGQQQKGDDKEDENGDPKEDEGGEKEEQKKGDGDQKKEQPQQPQNQQTPRKSQLSPQQIKNLLEAVQNEEKKSKDKMDAQKVKKVPVKKKKDW